MPIVSNEQPRKGGFSLGDYVEVKDRIRLFYERYPDGRLVTEEVRWPEPMDDLPRISVKALAYRSEFDSHPGVGWSWMVLPGSTTYTRGSELENTETSAWGRAIGSLGIGIDKSIASVDEIGAKGGEAERKIEPPAEKSDDGGLIGIAEVGTAKDSDFELRETPDGWALGFRLKANGRGGIKVIARDALAQALATMKQHVVDVRVTCYGRIRDETFRPKNSRKDVVYQVLDLERIRTPDWELPAVSVASRASDGIEDFGPPVAPGQVELLPLDPEERALIGGDLG